MQTANACSFSHIIKLGRVDSYFAVFEKIKFGKEIQAGNTETYKILLMKQKMNQLRPAGPRFDPYLHFRSFACENSIAVDQNKIIISFRF